MDVVTIEKTNQHFRILYDIKGRFQPHKIDEKEAGFKLCKVIKKCIGKQKVPYIVTHDGRTLRFPHPDIQIGDSVKIDLKTHQVSGVIKFQNGATVMLTGGNNIGRIGVLQSVEKHPGSFDIAHVKDSQGHAFSTRTQLVQIIGDGKTPAISLPKGEGIKLTLIEEREAKLGEDQDEVSDEDED
uniref:40S ribosomal protein S4 n=1 Tax=Strombidium rassoulzadegani TaxID=1082188 RepID=A0A7S3FWJ8_9SPIT|mmetsp:Transcript_4122/g.6978  ORF Transcript_4122/g.6978 Transcript_4122/m.6978 type:complete len:184 (+) Transcript_4122:338-889(+)|eukprot:CAMPEP_0168607540 /NCGR_PEP_ID=MMETSP0449_2-20121227/108_1 /TAXON_ID=1082188 /ORGANISM="Strombidium rassoulzadegani, Strain ras09" /LENGTH=183 /DNA_ID=CAMNT_0008647385 /DNA_START=338 /DNA_END=889 /DNA_ORIENTATION=-